MIEYDTFKQLIESMLRPVVLIEGTRDVPTDDLPRLTAFARSLAEFFPHAVFRSGNARGSDEAFAEGVMTIDPSRLELILPRPGHRLRDREYPCRIMALSDFPAGVEASAAALTCRVSPQYEIMMTKRDRNPRMRAQADYLIRDTLKVCGDPASALARADFGIFYVNPADPMKGGTGHTIRACRELGVRVAFQDEWMQWEVMP